VSCCCFPAARSRWRARAAGARAARLRAVRFPFALEEQLASDVEALAFRGGPRPAGTVGTPVAVVSAAPSSAAGPLRGGRIDVRRRLLRLGCGTVGGRRLHAVARTDSLLYVRRPDSLPYVLDAEPLLGALR